MKWNFKKFCKCLYVSFWRISLPLLFSIPCSMLALAPWAAVVSHLPGEGMECSPYSCATRFPSLQVLEELLLPRSVNPGLQLQSAAYNGHEVSSHCEGCLSAQWCYYSYMKWCIQELVNTLMSFSRNISAEIFSSWNVPFQFKIKSNFLEIWNHYSIAQDRNIFYS